MDIRMSSKSAKSSDPRVQVASDRNERLGERSLTWPREEGLLSSLLVLGSELDHVSAVEGPRPVHGRVEGRSLTKGDKGRRARFRGGGRQASGNERGQLEISFSAERLVQGTNEVTYVETKFVLSFASSSGTSERVPPTICLTTPPWRSMHGRKSDRRCELDVGEGVVVILR